MLRIVVNTYCSNSQTALFTKKHTFLHFETIYYVSFDS